MRKIRKDDEVIIITGKDKGRRGKVVKIVNEGTRLLVDGCNMVKKHIRPNPNTNEKGGIREQEAPLHISNVAIYNPMSKKADRVGVKQLNDGRKVRIFKSTGDQVDL